MARTRSPEEDQAEYVWLTPQEFADRVWPGISGRGACPHPERPTAAPRRHGRVPVESPPLPDFPGSSETVHQRVGRAGGEA